MKISVGKFEKKMQTKNPLEKAAVISFVLVV